jgi:hypothetical protein
MERLGVEAHEKTSSVSSGKRESKPIGQRRNTTGVAKLSPPALF